MFIEPLSRNALSKSVTILFKLTDCKFRVICQWQSSVFFLGRYGRKIREYFMQDGDTARTVNDLLILFKKEFRMQGLLQT
jgi:hypothetical protein